VIVVDASTVVSALSGIDDASSRAHAVVSADPDWVVPEHWTVESFSVIRGLARGKKVSGDHAASLLRRLLELTVESVPVDLLIPRMWQLRESFTAYDAAYVALAESRGLTLVTSDVRLARAAVPYCRVELIA
jgi:predicted nucleic acid-binding protein